MPYTNPLSAFGNSIILLTNPEEETHKAELRFRNIKVLENEKIVKLGDPLMNEYGISQVIGLMESVINRNTVMGWLEDADEVAGIRNFFADTLAKDLMMNREVYGINDPTARDRIFFEAVSGVHLCLKRSFKQGERKFWKGSQTDVHHRVTNDGGQGGIKNWLGWKKK